MLKVHFLEVIDTVCHAFSRIDSSVLLWQQILNNSKTHTLILERYAPNCDQPVSIGCSLDVTKIPYGENADS